MLCPPPADDQAQQEPDHPAPTQGGPSRPDQPASHIPPQQMDKVVMNKKRFFEMCWGLVTSD